MRNDADRTVKNVHILSKKIIIEESCPATSPYKEEFKYFPSKFI